MNSLISLLWQFQTPNSPIVSTILKNEYQKPHHYFYSQKQSRVLRKKNPNVISLLQQEQKIKKDDQKSIKKAQDSKKEQNKGSKSKLLRIKRMKQSRIQVELCEHVVAMSELRVEEFEGEFSIIEQAQLILCSYGNEKKGEIMNIQYLSCQQLSKTDLNWKEKQKAIYQFVKQLSKNILVSVSQRMGELSKKTLQQENKLVNNNILRLEILLAINLRANRNSIFIVDAIKLIFSQTDILNIVYNPSLTPKFINHTPPSQMKTILKQERIQINQLNYTEILKKEKQKLPVRKCECCGNEGEYPEFKEVSNQQFKRGRKNRNLGMRGYNQEYYEVCRNCYEQL